MRELWRRGVYEADVLRSDIDASGYDLFIDFGKLSRHIQLKAVAADGKARRWSVNAKLCDRPSGCVIVIVVDRTTLSFESFLWFGNRLGERCDNLRVLKPAKHSKGNKDGVKLERADSFVLPIAELDRIKTIPDVVDKLIETA